MRRCGITVWSDKRIVRNYNLCSNLACTSLTLDTMSAMRQTHLILCTYLHVHVYFCAAHCEWRSVINVRSPRNQL